MLRIEKVTKEMKGQIIYIQGCGNNFVRGGITPLEAAEVVKVNAKTMVLKTAARGEFKLFRNGCGECHYDYHMYPSIAAFKAERSCNPMQNVLNANNRKNVPVDNILKAADLLGVDINIDRFLEGMAG